jgi:hypothetical protein
VITFHVRVHDSRMRLLPLMLLWGAAPAAVWAQSNVPSYAIRSSIHYRESGIPNATESQGCAVVTARALLDKDHTTTIELTTGKLDSAATPPGSFAYVQFRPLAPSGAALFTEYFRRLATPTGYYSFTWPSLHRGEQLPLRSYTYSHCSSLDSETTLTSGITAY